MEIIYGKNGGIVNNKIKNFSNSKFIKLKFDPVDLFMELGQDSDIDVDKYMNNLLSKVNRDEILTEIKKELNNWINISPSFEDEKLAKLGAIKISNYISKFN